MQLSSDGQRPAPLVFENLNGRDDDYEDDSGVWRHAHPVEAEGPIWLYITMDELPLDCGGEHRHRWLARLQGVSPFFACDAVIASALASGGDYLADEWERETPEWRIEAICRELRDYGASVTVATKTSTRAKGAFRGCAQEARVTSMFWGFQCDRQMNAIGNTGWDFLKGRVGFGAREKLRDNATVFQKTVIAWLNEHYPERREFQENDQ